LPKWQHLFEKRRISRWTGKPVRQKAAKGLRKQPQPTATRRGKPWVEHRYSPPASETAPAGQVWNARMGRWELEAHVAECDRIGAPEQGRGPLLPTEVDGLRLAVKPGTATGYRNVTLQSRRASALSKPFSARRRQGAMGLAHKDQAGLLRGHKSASLGYYSTAVEAAVAIARDVLQPQIVRVGRGRKSEPGTYALEGCPAIYGHRGTWRRPDCPWCGNAEPVNQGGGSPGKTRYTCAECSRTWQQVPPHMLSPGEDPDVTESKKRRRTSQLAC